MFKSIKSFIILAVIRRSVERVRGAHLRVIAPGQYSFFRRNVAAVANVNNTVSNLTGPKFEPQTSYARNKRVTARPTGRYTRMLMKQKIFVYHGVTKRLK